MARRTSPRPKSKLSGVAVITSFCRATLRIEAAVRGSAGLAREAVDEVLLRAGLHGAGAALADLGDSALGRAAASDERACGEGAGAADAAAAVEDDALAGAGEGE